MSTDDAKDSILTALTTKRGGTNLPKDVTEPLSDLLSETLDSGDEVFEMPEELFIASFKASIEGVTGDEMTDLQEKIALTWHANKQVRKNTPPPPFEKMGGAESKDLKFAMPMMRAMYSDQERDMAAMNLGGEEIKSLALSVETGELHGMHETEGMAYGSDPKMHEVCKRMRKSNVDLLHTLIDKKDNGAVDSHFTRLVADLNSEGRTQEVAVITKFWSSTNEVFGQHPTAKIAYLKDMLRKYRGRAFPVDLDFALYAKQFSILAFGKTGGMTDEQKEKLNKVAKLTEKVESLISKVNALATRVGELSKKNPTSTTGNPGAKCNFCGKTGHFAAKCKVNPDSANYDADFAAKSPVKEE